MGHIYVDVRVRGPRGEVELKEVLVDTGATVTVMPQEVVEGVGAPLIHTAPLELGDGRKVEARVHAAVVGIGDREGATLIATFPGANPVIGVLTLESLGLKADPTTGRLEETRPKGVYYFY